MDPLVNRARVMAACLAALCGCAQTLEPCPPGSRLVRSEDRCVDAGHADVGRADRGETEPLSDADASDEPDAEQPWDAAQPDAEPTPGWEPDAGVTAADAAEPACSADDRERWKELHQGAGLVQLLTRCSAPCTGDAGCAPEQCVRAAVGLDACEACTGAESDCTLTYCRGTCSGTEQDRECLACLCEAGCIASFEGCADTQLELCPLTLFGRDARPEEYVLSMPLLLRQKSQTGGLRATRIDPNATEWPVLTQGHFSQGFSHLVAFSLREREYILQHKSECSGQACLARISPVLRDGSFGHPVYADAWSGGFDEIEVFGVEDQRFLLRYKAGRSPANGQGPATVLIDRMQLNAERDALTLEPIAEAAWRTSEWMPFSNVEAFAVDGATYLLLVSSQGDELRILRVLPDGAGLQFEMASDTLSWSKGWDVIETLKVAERWYLLTYKSGRVRPSAEPAGQIRIAALSADAHGQVALDAAAYEATWTPRLTHLLALSTKEGGQLITHDAASGTTTLRLIDRDVNNWTTTLPRVTRSQTWGFNPPWDLVEIAGQGKW